MAVRVFTDMLNREVSIPFPPQRIISLVPSQTELLFDLGLENEVVGITKFCVHPDEWFRNKARVGGTKVINIEKVRSLQPDLIIANKEENEKDQVDALAAEFPVWISDIKTLDDSMVMMRGVGLITDREEQANSLITDISTAFSALLKAAVPRRVAYFIWYRPWMSVGADTFINNMLSAIGWENVFADKQRYPEIEPEELANRKPELVFLSSEPFPFKEKHIAEVKAILPDAEIILVDGEMFSWYGSRLLKAVPYFSQLVSAY